MGDTSLGSSTAYFGYGSNLWLDQMAHRCPHSGYQGLARLNQYQWIISERGYANIVKATVDSAQMDSDRHNYTHEVWGLVYSLTPSDEKRLDVNEGVPKSYQKLILECDFWSAENVAPNPTVDEPEKTDMLVYVSKDFVTPSKPKKEYIHRMNMGIKDALMEGVPVEYVKQVIRQYIPDVEDETVQAILQQQALRFADER